jgi:hypothetical protein
MQVVNLNSYPVQVKINTENGVDYVHVMAKRKVVLPPNAIVDPNWLVNTPNVKVI